MTYRQTEHDEPIRVTRFAEDEYGISAVSPQAMLDYGRALLVIAGADGEVAPEELAWLERHQRKFGAPEAVVESYRTFDFAGADLLELIRGIRVDVPTWAVGPHLVYHAFQMCGADGVLAREERERIDTAADAMGVPRDVVLTIHALVRMEESVRDMRKALFHIDT